MSKDRRIKELEAANKAAAKTILEQRKQIEELMKRLREKTSEEGDKW